jgi:SAM-dependent methyltransferase
MRTPKPTYLDRLARHGVTSAHPGGLNLTRRLLNLEKPTTDTVVLDVGCGSGQTAAYLGLHYPCKIVAVDLNPQMVAAARRKFAQYHLAIELLQADALQLPLADAGFDLVLSESVTVFTEGDLALSEYCRVLKPGGRLLAIEVTAGEPFPASELIILRQTLGLKQLPTETGWRQMFTHAGFNEIKVLARAKINRTHFFSSFIKRYFPDFGLLMLRYHTKLHYAVYRCQK